MNILVDINHPAHVHLFRNAISFLKDRGHHVTIVARDKEVTLQLLDRYGLPYVILSKARRGMIGLAAELVVRQFKLIPILVRKKINLCISVTGASSIYACRLLGIPFLVFSDSERAELQNAITYPLATAIFTPESYRLDHGRKHVRYAGFHELAYLHPDYFQPNAAVLKDVHGEGGRRYFVLRFVSWKASHDAGRHGFTPEQKKSIVDLLKEHGAVWITSEASLPDELEPYRLKTSPDKLHDVLYYAALLVTDSQTTTTEAALLGTPAVRYNSFVGPDDMGNFIELEKKYGLIVSCDTFTGVCDNIRALLKNDRLKDEWRQKRERLLAEKIDVSRWMADTISNYDPNTAPGRAAA